MAINRAQAAQDENAKLRLEALLRPKIRRIENQTVQEFVRSLGATGSAPGIGASQAAALEPVLRQHYTDVGSIFDHRITDQLPDDVGTTPEERAAIVALLALWFDQRAPTQAELIGETTARNAARSIELANQESQRILQDEGRSLSLQEEAIVAGTFLSRALRGRTTGIVMGETQAPAEAAKQQEARVLVGDETPIDQPTETTIEQEWVDQGDDLVRTTPGDGHRGTNIDRVQVGEPFIVGGQPLLYPGDSSLGATADNTANCRCSAVQDVAQVVRVRRAA